MVTQPLVQAEDDSTGKIPHQGPSCQIQTGPKMYPEAGVFSLLCHLVWRLGNFFLLFRLQLMPYKYLIIGLQLSKALTQ